MVTATATIGIHLYGSKTPDVLLIAAVVVVIQGNRAVEEAHVTAAISAIQAGSASNVVTQDSLAVGVHVAAAISATQVGSASLAAVAPPTDSHAQTTISAAPASVIQTKETIAVASPKGIHAMTHPNAAAATATGPTA
jgi:hypothetical protein